jgi:hypothetical protein
MADIPSATDFAAQCARIPCRAAPRLGIAA